MSKNRAWDLGCRFFRPSLQKNRTWDPDCREVGAGPPAPGAMAQNLTWGFSSPRRAPGDASRHPGMQMGSQARFFDKDPAKNLQPGSQPRFFADPLTTAGNPTTSRASSTNRCPSTTMTAPHVCGSRLCASLPLQAARPRQAQMPSLQERAGRARARRRTHQPASRARNTKEASEPLAFRAASSPGQSRQSPPTIAPGNRPRQSPIVGLPIVGNPLPKTNPAPMRKTN